MYDDPLNLSKDDDPVLSQFGSQQSNKWPPSDGLNHPWAKLGAGIIVTLIVLAIVIGLIKLIVMMVAA